jgi:hypothetical protein
MVRQAAQVGRQMTKMGAGADAMRGAGRLRPDGEPTSHLSPLPDGTRLLHIGPQKTGSTALQGALHRARAQLRSHGVFYPGPTPRPWEALGAGLGISTPRGGPQPNLGAWHRLLAELAESNVRVACISHEGLGRCRDAAAARVVASLGGERPHVLAVARSYDRLFPSQWQQRVKARMTDSYEEWLRIVLDENARRGPTWRNLWIPHDTVRLVKRWARLVGMDNLTLVIASERDRYLLPQTCERLLGLPHGMLKLSQSPANRSLTYPEVELLRGLNHIFDQLAWSDEDYFDLVASGTVPALLKSPPPIHADPIPAMPAWAHERVAKLSSERVHALSALGVRVVGDLDALLVAPDAGLLESTTRVQDSVPSEVAMRALEGMARAFIQSKEGRSRRARAERRAAKTQMLVQEA